VKNHDRVIIIDYDLLSYGYIANNFSFVQQSAAAVDHRVLPLTAHFLQKLVYSHCVWNDGGNHNAKLFFQSAILRAAAYIDSRQHCLKKLRQSPRSSSNI
jgi:hypothetical protein